MKKPYFAMLFLTENYAFPMTDGGRNNDVAFFSTLEETFSAAQQYASERTQIRAVSVVNIDAGDKVTYSYCGEMLAQLLPLAKDRKRDYRR